MVRVSILETKKGWEVAGMQESLAAQKQRRRARVGTSPAVAVAAVPKGDGWCQIPAEWGAVRQRA